jgi:hypothetical protein
MPQHITAMKSILVAGGLLVLLLAPASAQSPGCCAGGASGEGDTAAGCCAQMGQSAGCCAGAMAMQGMAGMDSPGMGYDRSKEATITGSVQEVVEHPGPMGHGIHLMVRAGEELVEVHLGPASFLEGHSITFKNGDRVEILGSRSTLDGKPMMVARRVTRGGEVLNLRDEMGRPAWMAEGAGGHMGHGMPSPGAGPRSGPGGGHQH